MHSFSRLFLLAAVVLATTSQTSANIAVSLNEAGGSGVGQPLFATTQESNPHDAALIESSEPSDAIMESGWDSDDSDYSDWEDQPIAMRPRRLRRRQLDTLAFPPAAPPVPLFANNFYPGEIFTLYNRYNGVCMSVKPHRRKPKLITERCNLQQQISVNSSMAFHWKPSADGLWHLAIIYDGTEMCARHRWNGTYFYPCNPKSTLYSISATFEDGRFQVRDAGRSSRCMVAEGHHHLRMRLCGKYYDQKFLKLHIAFRM